LIDTIWLISSLYTKRNCENRVKPSQRSPHDQCTLKAMLKYV